MFLIIGFVVVLFMVFGGYVFAGGKMEIIVHALPFELMIILGGSLGAFVIANSMGVIKKSLSGMGRAFKGAKWKRQDYVDLLSLLFVLIKTMRSKGVVAIEQHIEKPEESKIFNNFPRIAADHHVVAFIADYLRMMTMNFEDPHQMEDAMDQDLERHHAEEHEPQHALQTMADGLPAVGIVAAVLGIIKTMAAINEPVEVLGRMVGGALVGTFLGIFLSYLMVAPIAGRFGQVLNEESQFFNIIKTVLISHLHGNAPQISVEIGRRNVPAQHQPDFAELEDALAELPPDL
ncbi:flagellar motor protein MotA [Iodidimonas gelatinilytica]|uniref:Flagellar motor protein MotA n=2 Tax=Iodidimonas TaxID=2066486 RepID=A0A5A7MRV9_9PROT|nr:MULTISPECIES: flagellar motor stator protein MotA [Iodidimonas]GEQ98354.1 flagellar motor protein MotA [Iodidimonas gelatinilytica]GER07629.1 flagellar motor protein MotA [Kordiimonadales bacterium JCM 17843]GGO14462.1 flagellar motor protein MotA [Iodidimonas muriae]